MAKKESTFINMVMTLFIVALISSAALGFAYEFTKEAIAKANLAKKVCAIEKVVPGFTNNPLDEMRLIDVPGGALVFYPAKKDGKLAGTAIETFSNEGFGDKIVLMVGLLPDGTINNIAVVDQKETPGLGNKIEKSKSSFSEQFNLKNPSVFRLSVKKDGGDVDAITAATISSRAFCDAVNRAYTAYIKEDIK